jgi:hypothetical protein
LNRQAYRAGLELEDLPMKLRSTVAALLAITETLLAAKMAKGARAKQRRAGIAPRSAKLARFLGDSRPPILRVKG